MNNSGPSIEPFSYFTLVSLWCGQSAYGHVITKFSRWHDKHANSIVLLELKTHNMYVLTNSNFGKVVITMEYTKVVMIITAELSRAQSAHSGPPWITKFGYLCHRENLVMT